MLQDSKVLWFTYARASGGEGFNRTYTKSVFLFYVRHSIGVFFINSLNASQTAAAVAPYKLQAFARTKLHPEL